MPRHKCSSLSVVTCYGSVVHAGQRLRRLARRTVAGLTLPVPSAMKKGQQKPVEISIFGFGAGQRAFTARWKGHSSNFTKRIAGPRMAGKYEPRSGDAMPAYRKRARRCLWHWQG